MRQRFLTILYLIFYSGINGYGFFDNSPTADPLWLRAFGGVFSGITIICILLYLTETRPNSLRVLFKITPIAIVCADAFVNIYPIFSSANAQYPMWAKVFVISHAAIICFPSWYICFRFGYLKELTNTQPKIPFKRFALYTWWSICIAILIPVFFGTPLHQEIAIDAARIMGPISMLIVLYQRLKSHLKTQNTETQIATKE